MPKATPSRNPSPSEAEPLKWGILATGGIARKFTADLHASGVGRAVACGSRTIEGARTFAEAYGIPKTYGSYGELARDPEVEAIYVATPHSFHYNDALACIRGGKAVLCEKPLTLNSAQSGALFTAAEENGVFLMEALWTYHLPTLVQAKKWWSDGSIGEVRLVEADFGFQSPFDPAGRIFDPALGGGALLDVGVYVISLAQLIAGNRPPKIKASARLTPTGVDETTSVILDWHSGPIARLSCSVVHRLANKAVIHGTKGTITLPDFWMAREAVLETADGKRTLEDSRTTTGYEFEARAVTEAVRAGRREDKLVTKAFSLRLAATMDAIRKQTGVVYPGEN